MHNWLKKSEEESKLEGLSKKISGSGSESR